MNLYTEVSDALTLVRSILYLLSEYSKVEQQCARRRILLDYSIASRAAIVSMPSQRFCRRRFSFEEC